MKITNFKLSNFTLIDTIIASILGITSLAIYFRTLAPGLLLADIGEFQTVIYSLGMTHPTGYPVYVIIGRIFSILPFGDLAWRVNLFNALLSALNVSMIFVLIRMITKFRVAGIIASFFMATASLYWYFSVFAESYIPACTFLSSVILGLLFWQRTGKRLWLFIAAMLGGLSIGIHIYVPLIAPAAILFIILVLNNQTKLQRDEIVKTYLNAIGGALLGLAITLVTFFVLIANNTKEDYFYAVVKPNLSYWNLTDLYFTNPLNQLLFTFTARHFQHVMFVDPGNTMLSLSIEFLKYYTEIFPPIIIVILIIGFIRIFSINWQYGILLLFSWLLQMFFLLNYNIIQPDLSIFFISPFFFIWFGLGLDSLFQAVQYLLTTKLLLTTHVPIKLFGFTILFAIIIFRSGVILYSFKEGSVIYMLGSQFEYYAYPLDNPSFAKKSCESLINAVQDDAIIFIGWDLLFPCYYVADIQLGNKELDFYEPIFHNGLLVESTVELIGSKIEKRPIYFYNLTPTGLSTEHFILKEVERGDITLLQVINTHE